MVSRTKYLLDDKTVTRLFENAGITGITSIAPLGAGEYIMPFMRSKPIRRMS